jgi:hypothetical protein
MAAVVLINLEGKVVALVQDMVVKVLYQLSQRLQLLILAVVVEAE